MFAEGDPAQTEAPPWSEGSNEATVLSNAETVATNTGSIATNSSSISANAASISVNAGAVSNIEGYNGAYYNIQLNSGGEVSGVTLRNATNGNVTVSDFKVKADTILLDNGTAAFEISGGGIDQRSEWTRQYENVANPDSMLVYGTGFGANSDLIWWAGNFQHPDGCTKTNGVRAITKDGEVWGFGVQELSLIHISEPTRPY